MRSDGSSARHLARVLVGHQHDARERPVGARLEAPHRALLRAPPHPLQPGRATPPRPRTLRCHASSGAITAGRPPQRRARSAPATRASRARRRSAAPRGSPAANARTAPTSRRASTGSRSASAAPRSAHARPRPGGASGSSCSSIPAGGVAVLVRMAQREHGHLVARRQARAQLGEDQARSVQRCPRRLGRADEDAHRGHVGSMCGLARPHPGRRDLAAAARAAGHRRPEAHAAPARGDGARGPAPAHPDRRRRRAEAPPSGCATAAGPSTSSPSREPGLLDRVAPARRSAARARCCTASRPASRELAAGRRARAVRAHAERVLPPRRRASRRVLSLHNVDSAAAAQRRASTCAASPGCGRPTARPSCARSSAATIPRADRVLCVSEADAAVVRAARRARACSRPTASTTSSSPSTARATRTARCSSATSATRPTAAGVERFLAEGWPRGAARAPERAPRARGRGSDAPGCERVDGVDVLGLVADLPAVLAAARAVVVPIWEGGGTRLKVLEALAAGRAVVSTPLGAVRRSASSTGATACWPRRPRRSATALAAVLGRPRERTVRDGRTG